MSCDVGHRCGLDPTLLWLWHRLAAIALTRPLAWEPPHAAGVALKKKNELLYAPAIPLLEINPDKTIIQKDTCTPMFIAALFTMLRPWKQPECPSTDEWIKKMWYVYTMEYYSDIKKNKLMPFAATWIQLESLIPSEVRKRKTNTI